MKWWEGGLGVTRGVSVTTYVCLEGVGDFKSETSDLTPDETIRNSAVCVRACTILSHKTVTGKAKQETRSKKRARDRPSTT